jgi:hypothetical protein
MLGLSHPVLWSALQEKLICIYRETKKMNPFDFEEETEEYEETDEPDDWFDDENDVWSW